MTPLSTSSTLGEAMGGQDDSGFDTVEIPRRLSRWVDKFSDERLAAILAQLQDRKWLTDSTELCDGRTQAYYRAEALIERLITISDHESYQFQRRTWPDNGGHRWAIKLREE